MIVLHSFVNLFAGGRSTVKVFLFLFFILALFFLWKIWKRQINIKPLLVGGVLSGLYLEGLFLHLWYVSSLSLPLNTFVISSNEGILSSTTISHTHVAKAYIGVILSQFHISLKNADAGGAYTSDIPQAFLFLGAALLSLALIFSILCFIAWVIPKMKRVPFRRQAALFSLYAISAFSLVKATIDGGVLTPAVPIIGIGIIFFFLQEKEKISFFTYQALALGVSAVAAVVLFLNAEGHSGMHLAGIASLSSLILLLLLLYRKETRKILTCIYVVLFLITWWQASARDRDGARYLSTPIPKNTLVRSFDVEEGRIVETKVLTDTTVANEVRRLRVNPSYVPITIPWVTCVPTARPYEVSATLITKEPVSEGIKKSSFVGITSFVAKRKGTLWHTDVLITSVPCLPRPLNALDQAVRATGISWYSIVFHE